MVLAVAICRWFGLISVTTAIIAATFLVSAPPVAALKTTAYRIIGMFAGTAIGAAGAYWGLSNDGQIPIAFFPAFGAIVGILATLKTELTYTVAIGAVVAANGASGRDPLDAVVIDTCAQLLIGSLVAVSAVWAFEKARAVVSAYWHR